MSYIAHIGNLNTGGIPFAKIGKDVKTGKIRYFTHYDAEHHYHEYKLFEFDINYIEDEFLLYLVLSSGGYKYKEFSTLGLEIINSFLEKSFRDHKEFNELNGYPIDKLLQNYSQLNLYKINLFNMPYYVDLENAIFLPSPNKEGLMIEDKIKRNVSYNLLHEIGHLKVGVRNYNEETKRLTAKTGFAEMIIQCEPILTANGDIFLLDVGLIKDRDNEEIILEEMINVSECKIIDDTYSSIYPEFGDRINMLCDNKLNMARYQSDGMNIYYDSLNKIIPSRELAHELLNRIWEYNADERFISKIKCQKLIRKYEIEKRRR